MCVSVDVSIQYSVIFSLIVELRSLESRPGSHGQRLQLPSSIENRDRMTERIKKRILPPTPEVQSQTGLPADQNPHGTDDKLFIQLLDDLDNISGGGHRRRRAREIFSEWLFSQDVRNPQIMRLKMEQATGRRHSDDIIDIEPRAQIHQQRSFDVEPFQREQAARRSCGALGDRPRRPRPSSFHYRRGEVRRSSLERVCFA